MRLSDHSGSSHDIVAKIHAERLQSYKSTPQDIRQHYNIEEKERAGYCKRPLLELVQNIEDALKDVHENVQPPHACIRLQDDVLWVLNKGKPFDERGFQSLCESDDSPKHGKGFIGSKGTGFKAVLNWTDSPEIYSGTIRACFDRKEAERAIRKAIGDDTYDGLKEEGGWQGQAPLLRLPLPAEPDEAVRALLQEWTTVIRLPLKADVSDKVRQAIEAFDPVNLLFLRHIKEICFEVDDQQWSIERRPSLDDPCVVELWQGENVRRFWMGRKQISLKPSDARDKGDAEVGAAFPWDEASASVEHPKCWFNFFPVRNATAPFAGVLMHATFLLKPDRDELREDDPRFHEAIARKAAEFFVEQVLPTMVKRHGKHCLKMLRKLDAGSEHVQTINEVIWERVATTPFVPSIHGKRSAPAKLWLVKEKLDDLVGKGRGLRKTIMDDREEKRALCHPSWQTGHRGILESYGAENLSPLGHLQALQSFRPHDIPTAVRLIALVNQFVRETNIWKQDEAKRIARSMPIWLCEDRYWRPLDAEDKLIEALPSGLTDDDIPDWCRFHRLDAEFLKALKEDNLLDSLGTIFDGESWILQRKREAFLEALVLPALKKNDAEDWWEKHGMEALELLRRLRFKAEDEKVFDGGIRQKASEIVRVPTATDGWQPARKVYASKSWYEEELAWGEALAVLPDRYLLADTHVIGDANESAPLLRFLGVSWMPKIKRHHHHSCSVRRLNSITGWDEYLQILEQRVQEANRDWEAEHSGQQISTDTIEAWGVEGLEKLTRWSGQHADLLRLLQRLYNAYGNQRTVIFRSGPRGGDRPSLQPDVSFLHWQLRSTHLFAVDGVQAILAESDVLPAQDLFLEIGRGWRAWLPRLDLDSVSDEDERDKLRVFASETLGVLRHAEEAREALWWSWLKALEGATANSKDDKLKQHCAQFAADLVERMSKEGTAPSVPAHVRMPCETSNGLQFCPPQEAYILDEHKWEPLREGLIDDGKKMLLVQLDVGKKAAYLFGCEHRLLSKALVAEVMESAKSEKDSGTFAGIKDILEDDQKLARALALIAHESSKEKAEKLKQWSKSMRLQVVEGLRVEPKLEGAPLDPVQVRFHWEEDGSLWLDNGSPWMNLSKAICHRFELRHNLDDALENLLGKLERDLDKADDYLREKGIDDQSIQRWIEHVGRQPPPALPLGGMEEETRTQPKKGTNHITDKGHSLTVSHPNPPEQPPKPRSEGNKEPRSGGKEAEEAGRTAEKRVFEELVRIFGSKKVWDVSKDRKKGRECDIVVQGNRGEEWLIEVKNLKNIPGKIFLPQSEVETAKQYKGAFAIAFVHGNEIRWLRNPLEEQGFVPCKGHWIWPEKRESCPLNDEDPWKRPDHPPSQKFPKERFLYEISISQELWHRLVKRPPFNNRHK